MTEGELGGLVDARSMTLFIVLAILAVASVAAWLAHRRGRDGLLWFLASLFLPPVGIIGLIAMLASTPRRSNHPEHIGATRPADASHH